MDTQPHRNLPFPAATAALLLGLRDTQLFYLASICIEHDR